MMKDSAGEKLAEAERSEQRRQAAVWIAIAGGAFSIIVLSLLVVNYIQRTVFDERRVNLLDSLKLEAQGQADNEQLIGRIRELDLKVRQDRIRRLDFSHEGGYLLLGGVVVFLVGALWAASLKREVHVPEASGEARGKQIRQKCLARRAVAAGGGVLVCVVLVGALVERVDFATRVSAYTSTEEIYENWPRFRGPGGLGVSRYSNVPMEWDGESGRGIAWKSKVALVGHNSPVVWQGRVFLTGATEDQRQVYCFDGDSGELLWQEDVDSGAVVDAEQLDVMEDTGWAASTVVTDGRRVCAIFANGDVGCFSVEGKKAWAVNLGPPENNYGHAASLAMWRNLLLVQYDQGNYGEEKSKLIALDVFSGQVVWQMNRAVPNSWTTPILIEVAGKVQIITCGDPFIIAYDVSNGAEIWRAERLSGELAPSPIFAGGLVLAMEPYSALVAVRPDGRGDVSKTHIAWTAAFSAPDISSPVGDDEFVYTLGTDGVLCCFKVSDGTKVYEQQLKGNFQASPSLVGGRLYLLSESGTMLIAEAGAEYNEVGRCALGERCYASPAFVDGSIYIRGVEHLYCIGTGSGQGD
jgi:outer membrane protein assembly factor BamB